MKKTDNDNTFSNRLEKLMKEIPLNIRLNVTNEIMCIELITLLGYRENKMWTPEEDEILQKLCDHAKKMTDHQLEQIKEWEEDGKPQ